MAQHYTSRNIYIPSFNSIRSTVAELKIHKNILLNMRVKICRKGFTTFVSCKQIAGKRKRQLAVFHIYNYSVHFYFMFTVFDVGNDNIYINWIKLQRFIFRQNVASEHGEEISLALSTV